MEHQNIANVNEVSNTKEDRGFMVRNWQICHGTTHHGQLATGQLGVGQFNNLII